MASLSVDILFSSKHALNYSKIYSALQTHDLFFKYNNNVLLIIYISITNNQIGEYFVSLFASRAYNFTGNIQ